MRDFKRKQFRVFFQAAMLAMASIAALSSCAPVEAEVTPAPDDSNSPTTPAPAPARASLNVAWNANSESDLGGYRVHYGTDSKNYRTSIDAGPNTSLVISELVVGRTYYIAVSSYDTAGNESAYSDEVSGSAR